MSEKIRNIIERFVIPVLLGIALVAVSLWAMQQKAMAESYKIATENMYQEAYSELADNLYDMENMLGKLLVVNSKAQYILMLDEIWRLSGSAVSNMSQIPTSHVDTSDLNAFIVRLGDYAHSLTKKVVRGNLVSQEDLQTISELRNACATLATQYGERLLSGDIPIEAVTSDGYYEETQQPGDSQNNEGINEFPTLIYDGPFSESAEKLEAKGLTGEAVSQEEAQKIADQIAGVPLTFGGISEGKIRSYDFSMSDENGGWAEVSIAEQGGSLLWYMSNSTSNQEGKPEESEVQRYRDTALTRLKELGYENMTSTYAQYYGGAVLINFAATQGDAILYSDLIKVWVDRDTLKVIGIDARNYLFSHVKREMGTPEITMEEAEALLSPSLTVQGRELALIPLTPETECLCWEFKCKMNEDSYIVYINVKTGEEEEIFQIIDSEDGQLVI